MNNPQQPNPQSNFQQPQSGSSKRLLIILSIVIGVLVILLGCGTFIAYLNVQKQAEEARIAKEKAEEEKRVLQRSIEEGQRRAEEEKRRIEEERRAEEEKRRKAEAERIALEEAEKKRLSEVNTNANTLPVNKAKGQVSNVTSKPEVGFVDRELDAGFRVTGFVKNVGESGDLRVVAFLSCSEGEWRRIQNLYFRAGESTTLSYFFHEPTINATSCQARIGVSP